MADVECPVLFSIVTVHCFMCNVALVTFLWLQYWSAWLIKICEHRKTCIFCVLSLVKPTEIVLKNCLKNWFWNFTLAPESLCVFTDGSFGDSLLGLEKLNITSRVPTVRKFWVSQGKSAKTERVREMSGNFKILLTVPIIYALFSQFLSASGGRPCKHCRLVYIAIFYNGTKFCITFVYLVLFYWCRE